MNTNDDAVKMEIDGVLDLHMFQPSETRDLVRDYLDECVRLGIRDVRIIHGKGIGVLRTIVEGILAAHPQVESFAHPNDSSGWGATVVRLRPLGTDKDQRHGP